MSHLTATAGAVKEALGVGVPGYAHPLLAPVEWGELTRPGTPLHWAVLNVADGPGARQLGPLDGGEQRMGVAGDAEAERLDGAGGRGRRQMRHAASIQMSASDSSRLIRGRQPSRSRAVLTSACCQGPQPSGYG